MKVGRQLTTNLQVVSGTYSHNTEHVPTRAQNPPHQPIWVKLSSNQPAWKFQCPQRSLQCRPCCRGLSDYFTSY